MNNAQAGFSFQGLYPSFSSPITDLDCGLKCGPYNDYGVPVCCDIQLVVPSAFEDEWKFLESETDLWKLWEKSSTTDGKDLLEGLTPGQIPLQCMGYQHCQRQFRTITCRAFPFFPYLDSRGDFIGLTYYPDYREDCWVISNLDRVKTEYKEEFQNCFNLIFKLYPRQKESFEAYSAYLRNRAESGEEDLVYLDFRDHVFRSRPGRESFDQINYDELSSFGPFAVMKELRFEDEEGVGR